MKDNKNILAVMVGISGSGKSTYGKGLLTSLTLENGKPTELVSTDDIRLELTKNAEDQSQNSRVFSTARFRVRDFLSRDKNVIIDATSPTRRDRKDWIDIGKNADAEVRSYFINTNVAKAKAQNLKRDRNVPDWVIDKQLEKLAPPTTEEGFDSVKVI
jgi:predicted kinase